MNTAEKINIGPGTCQGCGLEKIINDKGLCINCFKKANKAPAAPEAAATPVQVQQESGSLTEKAMLVNLTISCWSARKYE